VSGKDLAEDLIKGLGGGSDWAKRPRAAEAVAYALEPLEKSLWAMVQRYRVYGTIDFSGRKSENRM